MVNNPFDSIEHNGKNIKSQSVTPLGGGKPPEVPFVGMAEKPLPTSTTVNIPATPSPAPVKIPTIKEEAVTHAVNEYIPPFGCLATQVTGLSCERYSHETIHIPSILLTTVVTASWGEDSLDNNFEATEPEPLKDFVENTNKEFHTKLALVQPAFKPPSWVRPSHVRVIRSLNCFPQVYDMIIAGHSPLQTARWIQDNGELVHNKVDTVRQALEHFKATIPKYKFIEAMTPARKLEVEAEQVRHVNALNELTTIYTWMRERLTIQLTQERQFKIVAQGGEKNYVAAKDLLKEIAAMQDALGIGGKDQGDKRPGGAVQSVDWQSVYGRESVAKVMADPESRVRVGKVFERIVDLYSNKIDPEKMAKVLQKKDQKKE